MNKIVEFTICLHCGCDRKIVNNQIKSLQPLEDRYIVHWNNRIDRYPKMYPTYSQLINHSIVTSKSEFIILINDRCSPKPEEIEKIINLLENGFACVLLYNVGFMGFSKELIRKIGWWDERFIQGWEDRDWVWRIKENNLALYESQESEYDYSWRSPLNHPAGKCEEEHLNKKWDFSKQDIVNKNLPEQTYQHWDLFVGDERPDISSTWKTWEHSKLNICYDKVNSGVAGSTFVNNRKIIRNFIK
jgi:hypothetical protein